MILTRRHVLLLIGAAALFRRSSATAQDRLHVVATFSILGDLVRNVGGERVAVATLVGPNGDVHVYSPTPADAKTLANAKAVFVNGLGLEGWIDRLVTGSGSKAPVVVTSAGIKPRDRRRDGHAAADPHAWQSIANAKTYVANIRDALSSIDPAGKEFYEANAAAYVAKLDALDNEVRDAIAKIPADHRKVITTHAAFGYFGDAYGIQFVSPEGLSTDAEPSAYDIAGVIAQIKQQKIPAVFMENISDPRLVLEIAKETGAAIGGKLYSDALSEPNGPAGSYLDMMRYNMHELGRALVP